jgi:hypothetical protein
MPKGQDVPSPRKVHRKLRCFSNVGLSIPVPTFVGHVQLHSRNRRTLKEHLKDPVIRPGLFPNRDAPDSLRKRPPGAFWLSRSAHRLGFRGRRGPALLHPEHGGCASGRPPDGRAREGLFHRQMSCPKSMDRHDRESYVLRYPAQMIQCGVPQCREGSDGRARHCPLKAVPLRAGWASYSLPFEPGDQTPVRAVLPDFTQSGSAARVGVLAFADLGFRHWRLPVAPAPRCQGRTGQGRPFPLPGHQTSQRGWGRTWALRQFRRGR